MHAVTTNQIIDILRLNDNSSRIILGDIGNGYIRSWSCQIILSWGNSILSSGKLKDFVFIEFSDCASLPFFASI